MSSSSDDSYYTSDSDYTTTSGATSESSRSITSSDRSRNRNPPRSVTRCRSRSPSPDRAPSRQDDTNLTSTHTKTAEYHIDIPSASMDNGEIYEKPEASKGSQPKEMDLLKSILHHASDGSGSHSDEKGEENKSEERPSSGGSVASKDQVTLNGFNRGNPHDSAPNAAPVPQRKARARPRSAKKVKRTSSAVTRRTQSPPDDSTRPTYSRRHSDHDIHVNPKNDKEIRNEKKKQKRNRKTSAKSKTQPQFVHAKYAQNLEEKYSELRELLYGDYKAQKHRGKGQYDVYSQGGVHPPSEPPPSNKRNNRRKAGYLSQEGQLRANPDSNNGVMSQGVLGNGNWQYGTAGDMKGVKSGEGLFSLLCSLS